MSIMQIIAMPEKLTPEQQAQVESMLNGYLTSNAPANSKKRNPGLGKGLVEMKSNFDDPLDEFKEYAQ